MRLYLNDTSPFARLVLTTALETEVEDMDLLWIDPWASPQDLLAQNPFSTVPTLILNDGTALYESLLICECLMATMAGVKPARSSVASIEYDNPSALQRLALGKTLMEVAFRKVITERFASGASGGILLERANAALVRALNSLDTVLGKRPELHMDRSNFPDMCLAVALEYVRFRLNALFDTQVSSKALTWLAVWHARPSFKCTAPERLKTHPASLLQLRDH